MNRIQKNQLLNYLPDSIPVEKEINPARIYEVNNHPIKEGDVVYLISREFRYQDNFALNYSILTAEKLNKKLRVVFMVPEFENEGKNIFFKTEFEKVKQDFKQGEIDIETMADVKDFDFDSIGLLIKDFDLIEKPFQPEDKVKIIEIDGKNIIPARYISDKQEYNAASFRRKVYYSISGFLTDFPNPSTNNSGVLNDFIENKLPYYFEYKNNPTKHVTSGFSKYFNFGFISPQRVAIKILRSNTTVENKEAFLEELIVRRELAENFCLYCEDYKSLKCVPDWAKLTLKEHSKDIRTNIFSTEELENAQTYDELWNAAQRQLVQEGKIEGYLRMYWAKQILLWTKDAETALKNAIYLNDKYAYDAPSTNGYVGILWSIAGLHDRPFANRPISGKIRSMTYNGAKHKFDVNEYIKSY